MNIFASHMIMLGLTVLLIIVMIFSINSLINQWKDFLHGSETDNVCVNLKKAVLDVYQPSSIETNTTIGKTTLLLPDKIADSKYLVSSANNGFSIFLINVTKFCNIDVPAKFSGSAKGGSVNIIYERTNSEDFIVMES